MNKKPLVSVIIPVYNTAAYLREAIDSVLAQTFQDFEVILIDDGSTDGSSEIMSEYSDRVNIITKRNAGQAAARNDGFDVAVGRYIYFMDSDDKIAPETLEVCVTACERDDLDFCFFDGQTFGEISWFGYERSAGYEAVRRGPQVLLSMLKENKYRCSVCMCLYRRTFLLRHDIHFYPGIIHEDELFSAKAYFRAKKVKGIPQILYYRRMRESSTMTARYTEKHVDGYLTVARELRKYETYTSICKKCRRKLISGYMKALMDNSWRLETSARWRIAKTILFKYPYSFRLRPFCALMLKKHFVTPES